RLEVEMLVTVVDAVLVLDAAHRPRRLRPDVEGMPLYETCPHASGRFVVFVAPDDAEAFAPEADVGDLVLGLVGQIAQQSAASTTGALRRRSRHRNMTADRPNVGEIALLTHRFVLSLCPTGAHPSDRR